MTHTPWPAEGARRFGAVNWLGMWTLYLKEVRRFWKVMTQTVAAPVITTLLYLAIFALAIGKFRPDVHGVPFVEFLAPGLIMMTMIQNAFATTSSSLLISKIQGNIVDVLMPPLSPMELNIGIALAGVTRGLVCGTVTAIAMLPFVNLGLAHLWALLFFAAGASPMLSLFGILGGIWSEKFDHLQAVTNFVILPLTLSVRHLLFGDAASRLRAPDHALEPRLLPDRRLPLRRHRPCRWRDRGWGGAGHRRQPRALDRLPHALPHRLPPEGLSGALQSAGIRQKTPIDSPRPLRNTPLLPGLPPFSGGFFYWAKARPEGHQGDRDDPERETTTLTARTPRP